MLLREPRPPVKCYTISLTDEEREIARKNKENLSPVRKKLDGIMRRAKIRKMREEIGYPYDRVKDLPPRRRFLWNLKRGKSMLNRKSQRVHTFTFGITPEEARKIRRQKELDKMPTLENRFKRAKRNARRRNLRQKYKIEVESPKKIKKIL